MHEGRLRSFDGTEIAYLLRGTGDLPLVVCNGYGGTFNSWDDVCARLDPHTRALIWDYRGMHRSGTPADAQALRIEDHVRDLERLLDVAGFERFSLIGWSVGVQVALEAARAFRHRVDRLILHNGAHDRVLDRLLGPLPTQALPMALGAMARGHRLWEPLVKPPLRRIARHPLTPGLFARLGVAHGQPPSLPAAFQSLVEMDLGRYLYMGRLANEHRTEPWLPSLRVPTLVTAGGQDTLTPPTIARRTAALIPGARYTEFPAGTHYTLMEFPDELAHRVLDFLRPAP